MKLKDYYISRFVEHNVSEISPPYFPLRISIECCTSDYTRVYSYLTWFYNFLFIMQNNHEKCFLQLIYLF